MATKDNMMNKEINKEMTKYAEPLISLSIENDLEKGFPTSNRKVQGDTPLSPCCDPDLIVVIAINFIVIVLLVFILGLVLMFSVGSNLPGSNLLLGLIQICASISPYICGIYGATNYKLWGVIVATIMHSLVGSVVMFVAIYDGQGLSGFSALLVIFGLIISPHIILIKGMRNRTTSDPETSRQHDINSIFLKESNWKKHKLINAKRVTKEKKEHTTTNKNTSLQRKKITWTNMYMHNMRRRC